LLRQPSLYRTSFAIEELAIDLDDGKHPELIFKNLSWQSLSDNVRRVKPQFLHNPLREIEVYRTILASAQIGTATCYGVHVDEPRQHYWLFLEKVPGLELYQIGEFEKWQAVARWLAEFHARFFAHVDQLNNIPSLLRYDGAFYRRWLQRACAFAKRRHDPQNRNAKAALTELAARYEKVVERLLALPLTFIHGEFYSSNVLIREEGYGMRVCPVDWEMAGWGPGLIDLAALTAGKWSEEQKKALALAYYHAQTQMMNKPREQSEFLADLDHCRLHIAMQWLGWAPNWSPPAENEHDWLGEALHLAEKLAL
jgi:aminoglycoside phosphotransferase (APT) family kinase protein